MHPWHKNGLDSLKEKPNYLSNSTSAFSINLNDSKKIKKEEKIIRLKATRSGICLGILQWLNIIIFGPSPSAIQRLIITDHPSHKR